MTNAEAIQVLNTDSCADCSWGSSTPIECDCPECPVKEALQLAIAALERDRHGRWIDSEPNTPDFSYKKNGMAYYCSCCLHSAGKYKHRTYHFCPWCGAEMDAEPPKEDKP